MDVYEYLHPKGRELRRHLIRRKGELELGVDGARRDRG